MNGKRILAYSLILLVAACRGAESYDSINLLDPIKLPETAKPVAVAASSTRLFVLDEKKSQLFLYDLNGRLVTAVGSKGSEKESLSAPRGVALGPDGRVFIADTGNSRVQMLDADGKFLGFFGARGSAPGELRAPESVAVGQDGRVYVADTGNNRVSVFTDQGILLFTIGSSGKEVGQFKSPTKVAVDPSDDVFVLDSGNDRIQEFDASAHPIKQIDMPGNDFAVDAYGYVYILEGKSGKVVEHNPQGAEQGRFGSAGTGPGQSKKPEGVAVAPDGTVLVVDTGNRRVHRAELPNKAKTTPLPLNEQTKVLVSGPSKVLDLDAETLGSSENLLFAWLPKAAQLAVIDENGKETLRVGAPKEAAKSPALIHGCLGVALSPKHGFFVSDTAANRLQTFGADGQWKKTVAESSGLFDSKKKEGRVKDPRGVAINEKGTIYVADAGNRRVDAFSPEGVFLFGVGPNIGTLQLQEPTAVAWDTGRFLYILDRGLKRVIKTEPSGAYLASWGEPGAGPGQLEDPIALAYDGQQFLYVLDAKNKRVSVFSNDGRWMTDLFSGATLGDPAGLAVEGSRLFISDKAKGKVLAFDLHFRLAAPGGLAAVPKDGVVAVTWQAVKNAWLDGYEVSRASEAAGPYAALGTPSKARFEDSSAVALAHYWYRVASRAKTGDAGVPGAAVEVVVPEGQNRAPVELSSVTLGNIFSANYKWYLKNPVGEAIVTNNVNAPFENVKLTFRLKDFMDFGYDTEIKTLAPQQTVKVPLIATLNNKILEVSEDTPVQAEFTLTYFQNGQERKVSLAKPLRVYSRNAITWDDPRRIATFITPKDPPVLEFARTAAGHDAPHSAKADVLNRNLLTTLQIWDALSEHGMSFFTNPGNPYEAISEDPNFPVDYTQFPRETLKRKSGQCDDLTTLLISMLDGSQVKSAIADYPGHMAFLIDTEAGDLPGAGLAEDKLIKRNGTYWIPVEATMIGKPLQDAVAKAAQAFKAEDAKGKVTVIDVGEAWKQYEPATLPDLQWKPEVPVAAAREARFTSEVAAFFEQRDAALSDYYSARLKAKPGDSDTMVDLALLDHQAGRDDASAQKLRDAVAADPKNSAALTDLGNIAYSSGAFADAERYYQSAVDADIEDAKAAGDTEDPDLWLNLARAQVKLNEKDKAQASAGKAVALDDRLKTVRESLLKGL